MIETGLYEGAGLQSVDPKGRVAIPADFRSTIDRNSAAKIIVVGFHPTLPCLRAYDTAWSHSEEARFRKMADDGVDLRQIERERESVFGDVERSAFDPSGRFVLPEFFRDDARIADWAFFVGAGPTFNIWAPQVLLATEEASPRLRNRCAHMMANRKARG
ncbi:division/cell wall cluster transcriptional repressor MraZ [Sphingomonas sp.]|uniref:division/cell wall cluster transcriptional repressor MraZ n=1 Tax=Sphingomonas sp. TaxID=28214 RepID=UPI002D0C5427|nr:division/cell wall cluster transcriptional repressor MraZ [Sphingomonas sp.]HWK36431.1 division/cell wall cluster transcriptional repressor MraZ [Sphingomonas sp.]